MSGSTPNRPSSWNNTPATQIPTFDELQSYVNRQDTSQEEKIRETESLISNNLDISSKINEIIRILQLTTYDEDEWLNDDITIMKQLLV